MRRLIVSKWLLTGVLSLGVLGCGTVPQDASNVSESLEMPANALWRVAQSPDGEKLLLAYYDDRQRLYFGDPVQGEYLRPLHPDGSERASSGLDVKWSDGRFYLAFRDKEPQRDVFVVASDAPGHVHGVAGDSVPLARVRLLQTHKGLGIIWYGEKNINEKKYHIYYRDLAPGGAPAGAVTELFEGIYPVAAVTPSGRLTAITWYKSAEGDIIAARTRRSNEDNFGPEVLVAKIAPLTPAFAAVASGERVVAVWHAQYGESRDQFRLEGAFSDNGDDWTRFQVDGFDGLDIESLDIAADGAGNIALAVAAIHPEERLRKTGKMRVFLVTSHDNGRTWSAPRELRRDPLQAEGGRVYAHARSPKVAFFGTGRLLVAWQDWRSLRSAIHVSYSVDAGRTWAFEDVRWTKDWGTQEGFPVHGQVFFPSDRGVKMAVERFADDAMREKRVVLHTLDESTLRELAQSDRKDAQPARPVDRSRLAVRAAEYWRAMEARDWQKVYSLLDPYFRAKVTYDVFKEAIGKIEYRDARLLSEDFYGPLGMSVAKMTVEVKPFTVNRKTFKLDPVEKEVPTRWIWIDGDWYLLYKSDAIDVDYAPF